MKQVGTPLVKIQEYYYVLFSIVILVNVSVKPAFANEVYTTHGPNCISFTKVSEVSFLGTDPLEVLGPLHPVL